MDKIFLMCSERSGSNFISRLLNAHSEICSPPPKHLFNPLLRNLYRYEPLERNWEELLKDVLSLFNAKFTYWERKFEIQELKENVTKGDVVGLLNYFFESESRQKGKTRVFIKENKIFEFFPFLIINYPHAKYIFQVRDPRDMALSWRKNPTHPGGIITAAKQWKEDQQNSLKNANLISKNGNVIITKYEDLVENTADLLKEITRFLGLEYEETMLDYHQDNQNKKNSSLQHAWSNLSKGVMQDNFNKFRGELTSREIAFIEKLCFFEMTFLGYKTDNSWEDLKAISNQEIEDYSKEELKKYPQVLTDGVRENIIGKTTFYEKRF